MNTLEIRFRQTQEPDRRYRILVQLVRSDRPRFWSFHCPNCKVKVIEFQNMDMYSMTDFYDAKNTANHAVGIRCDGVLCKYYYYFMLA